MKWDELAAFFDDRCLELGKELLQPWRLGATLREVPDGFVEIERKHEPTIFAAIEALSAGSPLPELTPEARLMLFLRVDYASHFCWSVIPLHGRGLVAQPKGSREDMIWLLLTDCWENGGFGATHGMIEFLLSDVPPARGWFADN